MSDPCNTEPTEPTDTARDAWVDWLKSYGAGPFYDAFIRTAQGARSLCVHCEARIFLDIREGGGVPDWRTRDGDYGCPDSPDTDDEGTGGHEPIRE